MIAPADELPVGGTLEDGLGARVDHLKSRLVTLRPFGDEAPPKFLHAPAVLVVDRGEHLLRRGDVEALEAEVRSRLGGPEPLCHPPLQLIPLLAGVAVATTHGPEASAQPFGTSYPSARCRDRDTFGPAFEQLLVHPFEVRDVVLDREDVRDALPQALP